MKALDELNYSPNQIARSLKNKATNTVGIIVPDISEDFFAYVIKGVDDVMSKNGYTIILCDTGENPEKEESYLNLLFEKQIDGIILATVNKHLRHWSICSTRICRLYLSITCPISRILPQIVHL